MLESIKETRQYFKVAGYFHIKTSHFPLFSEVLLFGLSFSPGVQVVLIEFSMLRFCKLLIGNFPYQNVLPFNTYSAHICIIYLHCAYSLTYYLFSSVSSFSVVQFVSLPHFLLFCYRYAFFTLLPLLSCYFFT